MPTREIRTSVIVDGSRSEVWDVLTSVAGVTSCIAPGADIHPVEGGHWKLAFDSRGAQAVDGGEIEKWARDQELTIRFASPAMLKGLAGTSTRLVWAIEPLAANRQRVCLTQTGFGDGPEWDRLYAHLSQAWEPVLERLRMRMALSAPTISDYDPFWAGL